MKSERRRIQLVDARFQLRQVGAFAAVCAAGFVVQAVFAGLYLARAAGSAREGSERIAQIASDLPVELLLYSLGLFLPFVVAVGILATHRIAGPAYRMERYLRDVLRGEASGPCVLRRGDELRRLCEVLNLTVAHLRDEHPEGAPEGGSPSNPEERRRGFRALG